MEGSRETASCKGQLLLLFFLLLLRRASSSSCSFSPVASGCGQEESVSEQTSTSKTAVRRFSWCGAWAGMREGCVATAVAACAAAGAAGAADAGRGVSIQHIGGRESRSRRSTVSFLFVAAAVTTTAAAGDGGRRYGRGGTAATGQKP